MKRLLFLFLFYCSSNHVAALEWGAVKPTYVLTTFNITGGELQRMVDFMQNPQGGGRSVIHSFLIKSLNLDLLGFEIEAFNSNGQILDIENQLGIGSGEGCAVIPDENNFQTTLFCDQNPSSKEQIERWNALTLLRLKLELVSKNTEEQNVRIEYEFGNFTVAGLNTEIYQDFPASPTCSASINSNVWNFGKISNQIETSVKSSFAITTLGTSNTAASFSLIVPGTPIESDFKLELQPTFSGGDGELPLLDLSDSRNEGWTSCYMTLPALCVMGIRPNQSVRLEGELFISPKVQPGIYETPAFIELMCD